MVEMDGRTMTDEIYSWSAGVFVWHSCGLCGMEFMSICEWMLGYGSLLRRLNNSLVGYIVQWDGVRYGSVKSGPAIPTV